ncbi:MAG: WG repeat-containing protein [Alistipes sp.]|nr:WG repeat-containing protein [Alistipes sp.]
MTQDKFDIFISYSRKDLELADKICIALERAGISYFIDRESIDLGDDFVEKIIKHINNSRYFLFLASKNAYNGRYTIKEINYAIQSKPQNTIIPYIIDNSQLPERYKFLLADVNYLNIGQCPIETDLVESLLKFLDKDSSGKNSYLLNLPDDEFICFVENGKLGYKLRSTGEIVIPAKFENGWHFSENLARVKFEGKFGFIDKLGNPILDFQYEYLDNFSHGLAASNEHGKWGFIDKTGRIVIPYIYEDVWRYREGLAKVKRNDKWGFIDTKGKIVIPIEYDDVYWSFKDGLSRMEKSGKFGFINRNGEEIIPADYDYAYYQTEDLFLVLKYDKYFFIDKHGKPISFARYEDAGFFNEGYAKVQKHRKWGFINKAGKEIIPCIYDDAYAFNENIALVELNGECFYIDKNGERID